MESLTFSADELLSTALAVFAAAVHLCLGALAWDPIEKNRAYNITFLFTCICIAYYCLGEGLVHSGYFRYHPYFVPSPLLAGYPFVLMNMIVWHWIDSDYRLSKLSFLWLLGGVPGTAFSVLTLFLDPAAAEELRLAYVGSNYMSFLRTQMQTNPQFIFYASLYGTVFLHICSMVVALLLMTFTLGRNFLLARDPKARQNLAWALLSLVVGILCVVFSALLPGYVPGLKTSFLGPIATIPLSAFFFRALVLKRSYYAEIESQRTELSRYLPSNLVEEVILRKKQGDLGGVETSGSILFCDIRNFTNFSESVSPTELTHILNLYLTHMNAVIHEHGGVINKYIGDEIMVLFGLEKPEERGAREAFACALAMLNALEVFNQQILPKNYQKFRIGIAIHCGRLVHGNIGSRDRMEYTVIGDTVNTAARLASLTSLHNVPLLISDRMHQHLGTQRSLVETHSEEILRGRTQKTGIYQLKRA